jgi:hypothetical protein
MTRLEQRTDEFDHLPLAERLVARQVAAKLEGYTGSMCDVCGSRRIVVGPHHNGKHGPVNCLCIECY